MTDEWTLRVRAPLGMVLLLGLCLTMPSQASAGEDSKKEEREKYTIQAHAGATLEWERSKNKPSRLKVKKIEKGSEAEQMGYRKGDEIIAIGSEAAGEKRLMEFVRLSPEAASFRILRNKAELDLPPLFRTGAALYSEQHPLRVNRPAPAILIRRPDGERDLLEDTRGKVILLNFWASWCKPCLDEMPLLVRLQARFRNADFRLFCVNVDDDLKAMREYLDKNPLPLTVVTTGGMLSRAATAYDASRIPLNVLVDRNGKIAALSHGFSPTDQEQRLADAIQSILDGREPPLLLTRR